MSQCKNKPAKAFCQHREFITHSAVSAVKMGPRTVGHQLIVRVSCAQCGCIFHFKGVEPAIDPEDSDRGITEKPFTTNKGIELRIGLGEGLNAPEMN